MSFTSLVPPESVRCLKQLTDPEKALFSKSIVIPCLRLRCSIVGRVLGLNLVKQCTVDNRSCKLKPTVDASTAYKDKYILFDPAELTDEKRSAIIMAIQNISKEVPRFYRYNCNIGYAEWSAKKCIEAVIPEGLEFSGFTQAGHIVHLNLREELLPYKYVIGQILRDKISQCRTVVNKLDSIASEYRVFDMDLLAGDADYVTTVNVHKLSYKIDFSKTFWNTRLSTEHKRIWTQFDERSVVFDCCAGVGPFVLPAARLPVRGIYANDLNPDSVQFLKENIKINKLSDVPNFYVYNMDAVNFIREVITEKLAQEFLCKNTNSLDKPHSVNVTNSDFENVGNAATSSLVSKVHILMNLPSKSLSFLPHFRYLLKGKVSSSHYKASHPFSLILHCHMFVKAESDVPEDWYATKAMALVKSSLGVNELKFLDVHFVRKVAGRKWMMCPSFELPYSILFAESTLSVFDSVETKKGSSNSGQVTVDETALQNDLDSNNCFSHSYADEYLLDIEPKPKKERRQ